MLGWDSIRKKMAPEFRDKSLREAVYIIIFQSDTRLGKGFDVALILFILISVLNVMFQSVQPYGKQHYFLLRDFEYFFTAFFTLEYALRIYSSPKPMKYVLSFYGLIDLLAILPVYLNLFIPGTNYLIVMRAFRLIRVFRIFKLIKYLNEGNLILYSIKMSMPKIIIFFCFILILVISIGTIMYMVEGGQPDSAFKNIPVSIYWAIVTMTTVGYGDITPVTPLGRFLSALVMLIGYTIIAVPTGIVTASLVRQATSDAEKEHLSSSRHCPACGRSTREQSAFYCKYCGSPLDKSQQVTIDDNH